MLSTVSNSDQQQTEEYKNGGILQAFIRYSLRVLSTADSLLVSNSLQVFSSSNLPTPILTPRLLFALLYTSMARSFILFSSKIKPELKVHHTGLVFKISFFQIKHLILSNFSINVYNQGKKKIFPKNNSHGTKVRHLQRDFLTEVLSESR